MVSWQEFAAEQPELADRVRAAFEVGRHKTMATLRRDGSPRISGIETELAGGELVLGVMPGSVKARDLQRDPRLALHSPCVDPSEDRPAPWPGEAKVAGRAVEVPASGGGGGHRFSVDLTEVVHTRLGAPPDHLVIEAWHPGRGLERHRRR